MIVSLSVSCEIDWLSHCLLSYDSFYDPDKDKQKRIHGWTIKQMYTGVKANIADEGKTKNK